MNIISVVKDSIEVIVMIFVVAFVLIVFLGTIALMTDVMCLTSVFFSCDRRTYPEKQLDTYQAFEKECLSREYTKDQYLLIWSKDS